MAFRNEPASQLLRLEINRIGFHASPPRDALGSRLVGEKTSPPSSIDRRSGDGFQERLTDCSQGWEFSLPRAEQAFDGLRSEARTRLPRQRMSRSMARLLRRIGHMVAFRSDRSPESERVLRISPFSSQPRRACETPKRRLPRSWMRCASVSTLTRTPLAFAMRQ